LLFAEEIKMTDVNEKTTQDDFYCVLEGDGVGEGEVLFGSAVRLTFHIPALLVAKNGISLGLSVIPCGLRYIEIDKCEWYKSVPVPCEETKVSFSFIVPDEEDWKNAITPGFAFVLDADGLVVCQEFLPVRFVSELSSPKKSHVKKLEFDLERKIHGIAERVLRWRESMKKNLRSHGEKD
jgi:hypothetical protein